VWVNKWVMMMMVVVVVVVGHDDSWLMSCLLTNVETLTDLHFRSKVCGVGKGQD
jgi:hypothetical protein